MNYDITSTARPFHDYIDRTEIREGKGEGERHTINIDALYRQPLVSHTAQPQVSIFINILTNIKTFLRKMFFFYLST